MIMPALPPKLRITLPALAVAVLGFFNQSARAEIMPHSSIQGMCMEADLVVAGTYEGNDQLRVTRLFWTKNDKLKVGDALKVWSLGKHSRRVFIMGGRMAKPPEIETKEMVLFARIARDGNPTPIHNYENGSQGVIWYDDKSSYSYVQIINPGGYVLQPYRSRPGNQAIGKDALWEDIQSSVERRERYEDVKAIKEPERRARVMASVYTNATTPRGGFDGMTFKEELIEMGPAAVPAIAEVLGHLGPDEPAREIAEILNQIATTMQVEEAERDAERARLLKPAVEPLIAWMNTLDKATPYEVLRTLGLAADPRAIEVTRPYLKHEDESLRYRAIRALGEMKDKESFDHMAKLILASPDTGASGYNMSLMGALFSIDAERAHPVVEKFLKKPGNEGLRIHVPGRKP